MSKIIVSGIATYGSRLTFWATSLLTSTVPSMSGFDALKEIAKMKVGNIPVILLRDFASFDPSGLVGHKNPENNKLSNSKQLYPTLHNPNSSRIDATLIAKFFKLPEATIAKILRSNPKTVNKTPDADNLQEGLSILLRIACASVDMLGSEHEARVWLNTPHPDLDNKQPMELIKKRKTEIVADLLEDFLLGHPG